MLSPVAITKSSGEVACALAIWAAIPVAALSPVPQSPSTANLSLLLTGSTPKTEVGLSRVPAASEASESKACRRVNKWVLDSFILIISVYDLWRDIPEKKRTQNSNIYLNRR